jgi:S-formylglutathione hydrolase FrmB
MSVESISLVSGPTPIVIVVLGLLAVGLSFRWQDDTWKRQVLLGVPITGALVGLTAILVDGLALIPYQFPNSYYLWVGLVLLAVVVGIIGWRRFRNWRRVISVCSVLLTFAMAFTLINKEYAYYPTVGSVFGVNAQNQVSEQQLQKARATASTTALPTHGYTVSVPIPGTVSGFQARNAYIWVPPAWIADPGLKLPVIELLDGVPSETSDWTRAGFADETARVFANAHKGVAPILVMPDSNGSTSGDTECVNSSRGQAETYLTVDVPAYLRAHYNALSTPASFAVAGLSAGGTCAIMLALRHPELYAAFGDYSGLSSPSVDEVVAPEATIAQLFDGSRAAYDAHDPLNLLSTKTFPGLSAWFEVGSADGQFTAAQRTMVPLATKAGLNVCSVEIPGGGHDFTVWSKAFADSLPWLSYRLELTPAPPTEPATCTP